MEAITTAWLRCVKHTSRGTHTPSAEEALAVKEARWRAESAALRRSIAEAEQQRLPESTAQWQAQAAALAQPVEQSVRRCCLGAHDCCILCLRHQAWQSLVNLLAACAARRRTCVTICRPAGGVL